MKDEFVNATDPEKDEEAKPAKPKANIFWRLFKWSFFTAVFLFVIFTVLARLGGSSDVLRSSIEDFLTQSTPYTAKIGKLNSMQFFPNVVLDIENVELRRGEVGEGEAAIRIETAKLGIGFFDMVLDHRRLKLLHIQGFYAAAGSLIDAPIRIHELALRDLNDKSFLDLVGKIGEAPLALKMDMEAEGPPGRRMYSLGEDHDFTLMLGTVTAKGHLQNSADGTLKLSDLQIEEGQKPVLTGTLDLNRKAQGRYTLRGDIQPSVNKTPYALDLMFDFGADPLLISGNIQAADLSPDILKAQTPMVAAFSTILDIINNAQDEQGPMSLKGVELDVNVEFNNFQLGAFILGDISTPLTLKDSILKFAPLSGKISDGTLSGEIILDAMADPATLNINTKITDFDYAAFQKQIMKEADIEGRSNMVFKLSSKGQNIDQLLERLAGTASFVGGKGRLRSSLLDVWGGGLVNALLPKADKDADLNVNCVVVNADIESGNAQGKAIFVDTQNITLQGDGHYNFRKDELEIVLDPKTKDVAIGDVSSAVNITGPLGDLKVSPNLFDLGKRVGGVLAGALNPAFYALTLADLGLAEDHACKAFVIEKEELSPPESPAVE